MSVEAVKVETAPQARFKVDGEPERFRKYFEALDEKLDSATERHAKLRTDLEATRRFLASPFDDGLRDELVAELFAAMPDLDPAKLKPESVQDYTSCLMRLTDSTPTQRMKSMRKEQWQHLWESQVDHASPGEVSGFFAYSQSHQLFRVSDKRPNITPAEIPIYETYLQAIGKPADALLEADGLLSRFDGHVTNYRNSRR